MSLTAFAQLQPIKSGVFKWDDIEVKTNGDRQSRAILKGASTHLAYFSIHATTQDVGAKPSKAHANEDMEELVIVKEGEMKVTIEGKSAILGANGVFSLMPQQMHSLENVGDTPLTYYVIRYQSKTPMNIDRGIGSGGSLVINADSLNYKPTTVGGVRSYFDRPTAMCERLEMHVTTLDRKVASHEPHSHIETEIILMISGETVQLIDGIEYTAKAGDFYFMESESIHGIRNASDQPTTYFAFKWK
ncbi:cupin domain-containing protein [Algoriphagus chordae]|uniref:Cupin domain-containing protein n=1 Tax=Algoriphagus chordae TaxID=237019 RepID=A0A2W7RII1_9BACT|nr:cupin domain-containing protein [Algoriphagus chordae]PZX54189.1 Cupin domain-containing protein [Algoriphagus chordae]